MNVSLVKVKKIIAPVVPDVSDSASGTKNKNRSVNVFIGR